MRTSLFALLKQKAIHNIALPTEKSGSEGSVSTKKEHKLPIHMDFLSLTCRDKNLLREVLL